MDLKIDRWFLALACLAGVIWLALDAHSAAHPGGADDVHRQWKVCQYVRAGEDPYAVAGRLLEQDARERPEPHVLWDVPSEVERAEALGLIAEVGAPCATYPPSTVALWTVPLGLLSGEQVRLAWVLVNLGCLVLLARSLARWVERQRGAGSSLGFLAVLALLLLWPATHASVRNGQFSIPVCLCILWWMDSRPRAAWKTGLLIAIALVKPSLSLPFLIVPVLRREWRALGVAAALHGTAWLGLAAWLGTNPLRLTVEWLEVSGFFMRGQYSLQEILVGFGLHQSFGGTAITLGALAAVMAWAWIHRAAGEASLVGWLCAGSLAWTYHGPYDFVLLIVPIALALAERPASDGSAASLPGQRRLVAAALLGVALLPQVFAGEWELHRALRWAGRLGFATFVALLAWQCRVPRVARTLAPRSAPGSASLRKPARPRVVTHA